MSDEKASSASEGSTSSKDSEANPYAEDNFDPRPSDITPFSIEEQLFSTPGTNKNKRRIAVIRTTDRIIFKRCRRLWGWTSHLRGNLGSRTAASPLWLGSGFHYALEDFHGDNKYGHPTRALKAYAIGTHRRGGNVALPFTWEADIKLGADMLSYYADAWLKTRSPLKTFIFNGRPQLEVNFRIQIPYDATAWGYDEVVYSGTLDRVAIDENDILWILEYKTAKALVTNHFQTDSQVSAYCWAASLLYPNHSVGGVIYQQHKKSLPDEPSILSNGKLSTTTRQATDYQLYRRKVIEIYGAVKDAPNKVIECLNHFAGLEQIQHNKYIRRDYIYRNAFNAEAEGTKVLLETADMLNPNLPLYPNPTRECGFCGMQGPCVSMDDGSDWMQEIDAFMKPRETFYDSWRHKIPAPEELDKVSSSYDWNA